MCLGCYKDEGSPAIINDKTISAAKLIDEVYDYFPSGGPAHVVIDDWNFEDNHVDFCLLDAEPDGWSEPMDKIGCEKAKKLLLMLKSMTIEERVSSKAIQYGILKTE